jgi:hypothetical protein
MKDQHFNWISFGCWILLTGTVAYWLNLYGLNASSDSLQYLQASKSLTDLLELPAVWPPGYSTTLGLLSLFGLSSTSAAAWVAAIAVGFNSICIMNLAKEHHQSLFIGALGVGILAFYSDIHSGIFTILTEGIFCATVVIFCVQSWHFVHKRNPLHLWSMTLLIGYACLLRYAGYFLIPGLLYLVWMYRNDIPLRKWTMVFSASIAPVVSWVIYNKVRLGHFHGSRSDSIIGWTENLERLWNTLSTNLLAGGLILPFALLSLRTVFVEYRITSPIKSTPRSHWVLMVWGILLLQTALTLYSASTVLLDPINTRLTMVAYFLCILLAIDGTRHLTDLVPKLPSSISMLLLVCSIPIAQSFADPKRESKEIISEYNDKYRQKSFLNKFGFNKSDTAHDLREHIQNIVLQHEEPTHILWFEERKPNQNFQLLAHRDFLFTDLLTKTSETSDANQIDFSITINEQERTLIVENLTGIKNQRTLQQRIAQHLENRGLRQVYVIGRKPMLKKWNSLTMEWKTNTNHACTILKHASLYSILDCSKDRNSLPTVSKSSTVTTSKDSLDNNTDTKSSLSTSQKMNHPFISEVMIMPTKVAKFRGEWIELYNPTKTPIDLSEYSVHSKGDTGLTFENGSTIEPQSTFLLAVRKSHTGNGGLPKVDLVYNHNVLKVLGTDWLELKKGETIVDRWEFTRTDFKKGTALQRDAQGATCTATTPYGDGDLGNPGVFKPCEDK